MSDRKYHIETLAVHAGQDAHGDAATNARAVPAVGGSIPSGNILSIEYRKKK